MDRTDHGRHREWLLVWLWAVVWAGVMLLPYLRRARVVAERPDQRFTGVISAEFLDTAYHLSWVRQARDGRILFENKFAGADMAGPRPKPTPAKGSESVGDRSARSRSVSRPPLGVAGPRVFNLLFLAMGFVARAADLTVIGVFHVERTVFAVLVLVAAYWFAAQFFLDRRMRWVCLILVTTSAGLQGVRTLWEGGGTLANIVMPETVTFWSLEWWVVIGPATATLILSVVTARRALCTGRRAHLAVAAAAMLLQAAVYPHHVVTALLLIAVLAVLGLPGRHTTASRGRRAVMVLAAMLAGAAPIMAYHAYTLLAGRAYRAYAGQVDEYLTASQWQWPLWYGVVLILAVVGAAAIVVRRERDRALLVAWPLVVVALVATPFPPTQRVHLYHGLHIVLCLLAVRGLWGIGGLLNRHRLRRSERLRKSLSVAGLAVVVGLASVTNVVHFATEMGRWSPTAFAAIRAGEAEAIRVLDERAAERDVIVCLPATAEGLPMWTGSRVYVGHPDVTPQFPARQADMERLMGRPPASSRQPPASSRQPPAASRQPSGAGGDLTPEVVAILLRAARADVVYCGPRERLLGSARMERLLVENGLADLLFENADAAIYRVRREVGKTGDTNLRSVSPVFPASRPAPGGSSP